MLKSIMLENLNLLKNSNLLNKLKCLHKGHIWCIATPDPDGEVDLPNGETVYGCLDIYACFRCGKVKSVFRPEKEIPEKDWFEFN
jgi:hypothetical protein